MTNGKKEATLAKNKLSMEKVNITNPAVLERFKKYIKYLTTFDFIDKAYRLMKVLNLLIGKTANFEKEHSNLYQDYQRIILQASAVALPFLSDDKIKEILEYHLVELLDIDDLDLLDKLKAKMVRILMHEDRDVFKRELRAALTRNKQEITVKNILIDIDKSQQKPTVANWLLDYGDKFGAAPVDQIKISEYLFKDKNVNKLDEPEKNRIKKLLDIYEYLKLSSTTAEGLEEAVSFIIDGQKRILTGGRLETVKEDKVLNEILSRQAAAQPKAETVPAPLGPVKAGSQPAVFQGQPAAASGRLAEEILVAYQGSRTANEEIARTEDQMRKTVLSDTAKLRAEFYKAVQNKNVYSAIAAFRLLAQSGDLPNFPKQDEKLKRYLRQTWIKKFGPAKIKDFDANPAAPPFLQFLIRHVLQDRLGMSESEAARLAAQIGNILKKNNPQFVVQLAYYDFKSKRFKWLSTN